MRIEIVTPIKMYFKDVTSEEVEILKKMLTYKNKSIEYQIKKLKQSNYSSYWIGIKLQELEPKLYNTLLWKDEETGEYYTRPGLLYMIQKRFINVEIDNKVKYPEFNRMPWENVPLYTPHKAQAHSVDLLLQNPHSNIEFATGTGKSYIIMLLIKSTGLPTIVTTPNISIAKQLYDQAVSLFGKKRVGFFGGGKKEFDKHILIAIGKSLSLVKHPELIEKFKKYQVLISDESHTLPANTFEYFCHTLLGHCPYRWFLSGTQERTAGDDLLLYSIIGQRVYSYNIQQAIDDGILAKLNFKIFDVNSNSGYFDESNVVKMNQEHFYKNEKIASFIAELTRSAVINNKPVLILVDEHIQEQILKKYMTVEYAYAHAKVDVHKIVNDFNAGKIMCVVGTSAVSIGTNFKPVRLTINWQGNRSPIKIKQGVIGRSTRIDPESGKRECVIVDFRIVNVPLLKKHADLRINYYKNIGAVEYIKLNNLCEIK